jgi:AMP nucleosidase
VHDGLSERAIPLPFALDDVMTEASEGRLRELAVRFAAPDLNRIDDSIANGTFRQSPSAPKPLSLFTADRVDFGLARLSHYTGTAPQHFQGFGKPGKASGEAKRSIRLKAHPRAAVRQSPSGV